MVSLVEKSSFPLSANAKENFFKVYLADVGLLRKMADLPASMILSENQQYTEFKGAFIENYVLCEMIANLGTPLYFWRSGNTAEVDFVVQVDDLVIPIEVKSSENVKARSLALYRETYRPPVSVQTSLLPVKLQDGLMNLLCTYFGSLNLTLHQSKSELVPDDCEFSWLGHPGEFTLSKLSACLKNLTIEN